MARRKAKTVTVTKGRRRLGWSGCLVIFICLGIAYLVGSGLPESATRTPAPTRIAASVDQDSTIQAATVIAGDRAASDTPSATITDTPTQTAEAAAPQSVESRLSEVYAQLPGIVSVGMVSATADGEQHTVYLEVMVSAGSNTTETANALRQATYQALVSARIEFSAILDDGTVARDYLWSNTRDEWTVTELTLVTRQPTPPPATDAPPQTYYTTANARARECPSTNCDAVTTIQAGNAVNVVGSEEGETVSGSPIWMRVSYNGQTVYIHGTLLSANRPTPRPTSRPAPVQPTSPPVQQQSISTPPPAAQWTCSGDQYNCGDFSTCSQVMSYFNACPGDPSRLDGDNDGIPCESLCG